MESAETGAVGITQFAQEQLGEIVFVGLPQTGRKVRKDEEAAVMMGSCSRMMQGSSMAHGMPQLPPGNAKLQLQMHAEMMQRMGETLAKYAGQIKEDKK